MIDAVKYSEEAVGVYIYIGLTWTPPRGKGKGSGERFAASCNKSIGVVGYVEIYVPERSITVRRYHGCFTEDSASK